MESYPNLRCDYDEDAVIELWSVVLATACLDHLATRYFKTAKRYLSTLRWVMCYRTGIDYQERQGVSLSDWSKEQQADLRKAFQNGLGDIADHLQKKELIRMVTCQQPKYRRVRYYIQKSKTFRRG